MKYEQALNELRQIVQELNEITVDMDLLTEKTERAKELIQFCKAKLRNTELSLDNLTKELED